MSISVSGCLSCCSIVICLLFAQRAEMKAIDCQHFNFGAGDCPFGSKCFYRHVTRDGKEDTLQGRPRYLIGADGEAERMQTVRISDFFVEREKRAFKHEYGEDGIIFED
eukprot:m.148003 g.148003  ORF g.148003 m.148003 type:complete len:109 (-) comp13247_c3_seq2:1073-1399(-)